MGVHFYTSNTSDSKKKQELLFDDYQGNLKEFLDSFSTTSKANHESVKDKYNVPHLISKGSVKSLQTIESSNSLDCDADDNNDNKENENDDKRVISNRSTRTQQPLTSTNIKMSHT